MKIKHLVKTDNQSCQIQEKYLIYWPFFVWFLNWDDKISQPNH